MVVGSSEGQMLRAFLGLGSNLGDRWAHLRQAVDYMRAVGNPVLTAVSPVYETAPVGGPPGQDPYLNLVVELHVPPPGDPFALLALSRRLEASAGRVRVVRWGPRTLDVDVLWVDGVAVETSDLVVPHPRLWQRRFVLAPLADLAPDLVSPDDVAAGGGDVSLAGTL